MMHVIIYFVSIASIIEGVVLDPALYLSPSPPLTTTQDNDAELLWSRSVDSIIKQKTSMTPQINDDGEKTTKLPEAMEGAETFWPSFRSSSLRGVYIPLSFHLSGTYGGSPSSGVYSSSYTGYRNRDTAVLAGTNYQYYGGSPGLKIYGGETKAAWTGWGNGKWGHYGKG